MMCVVSRYVADTRETDPKACNPFGENNFQTWQLQLKAPLDVPLFKWWRCTNCQQSLIASGTSDLPEFKKKKNDWQYEVLKLTLMHVLS